MLGYIGVWLLLSTVAGIAWTLVIVSKHSLWGWAILLGYVVTVATLGVNVFNPALHRMLGTWEAGELNWPFIILAVSTTASGLAMRWALRQGWRQFDRRFGNAVDGFFGNHP